MSIESVVIALSFGIGFGYFVQRAGICFAHGLGEILIGKGQRIIKIILVIFIISNLGFALSGIYSSELGLKAIGEIRGYGFYNVLSGMFFGAGIMISGGCILGSLRQLGEGNLLYIIVILSFIPGMALVVYGLNPLLSKGYDVKKVVLPELLGVNPLALSLIIELMAIIIFVKMIKKKL